MELTTTQPVPDLGPPGGAAASSVRDASAAGVGTRWLLIVGLWSLPALLSASQAFVRERGQTAWVTTLLLQLPSWWIWAAFTPLVLRLAARHPIGRDGWAMPVARHVAIGSLVVCAYIALQAPFAILREGREVTASSYFSAVGLGIVFQYLSQLLIYFGIVGAGHAVHAQRRLAERERQAERLESELRAARLHALRAQLQPHFLFNTMHAVAGLVRGGRRDEAVETLSGLSDLLRFTLDHLDRPRVPLYWELEALERYLAIEEIRYQDRLTVTREVDPGAIDVLVPALILQPLVENAVKHGFGPGVEHLRVQIGADLREDALHLWVEDDGAGIRQEPSLEEPSGLGLRLTGQRLASLHPDDHGFEIERAKPRGTRVSIRIPADREPTP